MKYEYLAHTMSTVLCLLDSVLYWKFQFKHSNQKINVSCTYLVQFMSNNLNPKFEICPKKKRKIDFQGSKVFCFSNAQPEIHILNCIYFWENYYSKSFDPLRKMLKPKK